MRSKQELFENDSYSLFKTLEYIVMKLSKKYVLCSTSEMSLLNLLEDLKNFTEPVNDKLIRWKPKLLNCSRFAHELLASFNYCSKNSIINFYNLKKIEVSSFQEMPKFRKIYSMR